MSKKDYEMIASIIKRSTDDTMFRQVIAAHFADALRQDNPRFDTGRFLRACGINA